MVSQLKLKGEVVSLPLTAPSTRNSTFVTPTLSKAVAVMEVVPETVVPPPGALMVTVGTVVSAGVDVGVPVGVGRTRVGVACEAGVGVGVGVDPPQAGLFCTLPQE